MKKAYSTPRLTVHGDVEKITLQSGSNVTDVPEGTPCCDDIGGS
jgi:hypothetical protein